MTTTITYTDGTEEEYPRVKFDDGFVHCFNKSKPPARDGFDSTWEYWTVRIARGMMLMFQSGYYHDKSVPERRIEEVK